MKLDLFRVKDFYTHSTEFEKNLENSSRVINTKQKENDTISKVMNAKQQM